MKFLETSNLYSLNKSTYVNLRWISYFGQLTAILIVEFFLKFEFNYLACILIVFLSILTNLYLIFKIKLVNVTNTAELQIFKYWAENTEGIIIKKINGFVIPPVK